jgi:hypothetical protein
MPGGSLANEHGVFPQFKNVRNGWVQNVVFESVSAAVNMESTMASTVRNCAVQGKQGMYATAAGKHKIQHFFFSFELTHW